MKRKIFCLFLSVLLVLSLTACGGDHAAQKYFQKENGGLYLYADLTIEECVISPFDTDRYSLEELRALLEKELNEFNAGRKVLIGDAKRHDSEMPEVNAPVSIVSMEVNAKKLTQILIYDNCSSFLEYNEDVLEDLGGSILKAGKITDAPDEVLNASYVNTNGKSVSAADLRNEKDADKYRYFICDFDAVLFGDGEIAMYSTDGTYKSSNNSVTVTGGKKVIVIYYS